MQYDPQKAARVWQRVQQENGSDLSELLRLERSFGAACMRLARRASAKNAPLLQKLARQSHANAACIRAIFELRTGAPAPDRAAEPDSGKPEHALHRCIGLALRSMNAYESCGEPEYGKIFALMARGRAEDCRILLELLGAN